MSEGFAAVPTWMIRNESISIYAVTTYAALASRAGFESIYPSQAVLAREARCSERRVRDALGELEALGVVERVKRTSAAGRATDGYVLLSTKRPKAHAEVPAPPAGTRLVAAPGSGGTGTSEQTTPYIEIDKEEIDNTPTFQDFEELFAEAWKHWPKKKERKASLEKFKAKAKSHFAQDPTELVSLIGQFGRAYAATTEPQYVPALCFWLNRERWTDELPALPAMQSDQRMQSNLAVIAELEAQEQGELRA